MSDTIRVTKDGRTYEIPGIWCAGLVQQAALDGYTITVQGRNRVLHRASRDR